MTGFETVIIPARDPCRFISLLEIAREPGGRTLSSFLMSDFGMCLLERVRSNAIELRGNKRAAEQQTHRHAVERYNVGLQY